MKKLLKTEEDREQFMWFLAFLEAKVFQKGKRALQNDGGYCCLGVGCVLTISEDELSLNLDGMLNGSFPIRQKKAPAWLKHLNDDFTKRTGGTSLSMLNDGTADVKAISHPAIAKRLLKAYEEELNG